MTACPVRRSRGARGCRATPSRSGWQSQRRIWQEAGKARFSSFAELNAWLLTRCRALWQELRHPEYQGLSVAEMLEHEQPHLMPMVTPFDGYVEQAGRVSSTCLVSVACNHYSAPCEFAGKLVSKRADANLFFQLVSRRYERGPMILTSNQGFTAWGEVFGDRVIATAILDRLLHHAVTLNIRGNSYRLKEKLKAGLIRTEQAEM